MSNEGQHLVIFEGITWEVLKDCGDFYLCKEQGTDNVRNIYKTDVETTTFRSDAITETHTEGFDLGSSDSTGGEG